MVTRIIIYNGHFEKQDLAQVLTICKRNGAVGEISGNQSSIKMVLEGAQDLIKLISHQCERSLKNIEQKNITPADYQGFNKLIPIP